MADTNTPRELRVGVIGAGRIAGSHMKRMKEMAGVKLQAVADVDSEKTQQVANEYGATPYADFNDMFEKETLDAVLICTPPTVRMEPIQQAAQRGIAAFIEKPPAFDLNAARDILDVIEKSGIINAVGFMYRYSYAIDELKKLIAGVPLSIVRSIMVNGPVLNPEQPKWFFIKDISGGPVLDQAIHALDLTRYIAGDITTIQAYGANVVRAKDPEFTVEDSVTINLKYENGAIQNHVHSWSTKESKLEIELWSDRMSLVITPDSFHGKLDGEEVAFQADNNNYYFRELVEFFEAVRHNDQSRIRSPYSDAIKTLTTVLATNYSVDNNAIVDLGTDEWAV